MDRAGDQNREIEPPPVKVVVMGGSVAMGAFCIQKFGKEEISSVDRPWSDQVLDFASCSWSTRLLDFVNQLAGGELIDVQLVATGGTSSVSDSMSICFVACLVLLGCF